MLKRIQAMAFSLLAGVTLAAGEGGGRFAAPTAAVAPQEISAGSSVLQIFGSLLLVIATIVVIGWFAKRMKALPRRPEGALRVVDEIALGAKERAVLIEVDGARLVLGVGDGRVSLLHRSDLSAEDIAVRPQSSTLVATKPATPTFIEVLRKGLGK